MENQHSRHEHHPQQHQHGGHDHSAMQMQQRATHKQHDKPSSHDEHAGHHTEDFLKRFCICLAITIPVLLLSHMIQQWLGFELRFTGDQYVLPGAVVVFLVHAIVGLTSQDALMVRAAYLAMELSAWFVIIPACFGLGTHWGLFKHYWTAVKLLLTVGATILLMLHVRPISYIATVATEKAPSNIEQRDLRIQFVVEAATGLMVLLTATIISVYKPWGKIKYRFGKKQKYTKKSWSLYVLNGLILLTILIVML